MAELVLGLAKSTVEGTLSVAKSAIEEEVKLKKSMQRDLILISDEFEMMHSFLNVAKERATDEMVRTLVRQVRNMALDVEDCIESVVLVDINESCWWRRFARLLPPCSLFLADAPAAALDQAVAAAELLKCRVEAMGQRNERYWHIRDTGPKPAEKPHQQAVADAAAVGILKEARDAKKKDGSPRDLAELINKKKDGQVLPLEMMSLWGAAGDLGVASIIKKTFEDPEIGKHFSCRAWVKLMRPFNPQEFVRSMMAQFYTNGSSQQQGSTAELMRPFNPQEFVRSMMAQLYTDGSSQQQGSTAELLKKIDAMMALESTQLIEEFLKHVSDHKYLIFLENMSSTVDWEAVRLYLPDKKNGSCIVVHTQQLEVASLIVGQSHQVLELEQFSAEHSVCIFFNEKRNSATDLIKLINMKDDVYTPLQVISVCGKVGNLKVQMASIIDRTCDDSNPEICTNHFRYRAWVKLTRADDNSFDSVKFIDSLLDQLCTNYCPRHGSAEDFLKLKGLKMVTEVKLIEEFVKQVMRDQRYLVFLEAVSSKDDWDAVRKYLPDKTDGSCIIVHTEDPKVGSLCVAQPHGELELLLSADHSVRVLFKEGKDKERTKKIEDAKKWIDENKLVGRGADIEYIGTGTGAVQPVFGIAGVGKSYIVRHVYSKKMIDEDKPFDKFGWVEVSHPFNMGDFSWSLLLDLHSGCLKHGSMLRIRDPIQECCELLEKHACLIVIDGLQSKEEWDAIKDGLAIKHDQNKSRIIVIANEESLATYCSANNWWNVEGLEIEEALQLFKSTVTKKPWFLRSWPSGGHEASPDDIERAKSVLHKCGGLPKVIVAVGSFIGGGRSLSSLDNFMPQLETNQEFGSLRNLFTWVAKKGKWFLSSWPSGPEASPDDIERAKSVLHKCGGLPKVIVAVGDFIGDGWSLSSLDNFMPQLETNQEFGSLRNLFTWVNSYFNSCPDSLKPCIFYLSIFPLNHKIRRRRLVRRWIAEGYSAATKESTAEEKGEESFLDLCKLTMIQVPGSTSLSYLASMPSCKVNGFFREYIKSQSMEENLVFALEGHCSVNSQRTGRHLTIEKTWDRDISVYESIDFSRLRSLTVFGKWESFFISDKMRIVRVLDLEDASSVTDGDLEQMVKLLPRLKFLSLRGCKEITRLPDSFGRRMRQLQTLDIRNTCIVTLPPSITKLKKLQHIRAGTTVQLDTTGTVGSPLPPPSAVAEGSVSSAMSRPRASTLVCRIRLPEFCAGRAQQLFSGSRNGGVEAPRGIGEMMALHNISVIDVSVASGRAILEDLKNLTQLRKLGVSGIKRDNHKELCSVISGHPHLKSLSVWLDKNQAGCLDCISPPPEGLQSLKLYGCVGKLPEWIKQLLNLRKVKLQKDMITQLDVNLLKYLPSLDTLCLYPKDFEYGELRFRPPVRFRQLLVLEIACNSKLQSATFEFNVMPWLEVLKIRCYHVSSLKFFGLDKLNDLREVSLSGSFDDQVKQHLESKLKQHRKEVKPILKVNKVF